MKFFSRLFSKNSEKDFQVKIYSGVKLGWCAINPNLYSKKDSERLAFYLNRIHSDKNIFKSDFAI